MSRQISPLIAKQLAINRLNILPLEIVCIIKDYAFNNIESVTKQKKKKLIALFNNTKWGRYPWKMYSESLQNESRENELRLHRQLYCFAVPEDRNYSLNTKQFQCGICSKCGNFDDCTLKYVIPKTIVCTDMCIDFRDD